MTVSLYQPAPWTKFCPQFASKMSTYVSCAVSLTTKFTHTYLRRQYQYHVGSPKWRESQTTPKTDHPWDVMASHHGSLAAAHWYQHHGKVALKPSAPT